MHVGVVVPDPEGMPLAMLRQLRRTRATHLRYNALVGDQSTLAKLREADFSPLPILDVAAIRPREAASWIRAENIPLVELGNEPSGIMSAARYAGLVSWIARIFRDLAPQTRIMIACEAYAPLVKPITYWRDVRARLDQTAYDVAAIHPYRNPKPPSFTTQGTRRKELESIQRQLHHGKGIAVTEVGWRSNEKPVTEAVQGNYLMEELLIWEALGVDAIYWYAYVGEWGLLRTDWTIKPAGYRLAQFQQDRGIA